MARRVDATTAGTAVVAQADLILDWLSTQPPSAWRAPSALPGWSVAELASHIGMALGSVRRALRQPCPDQPITVDRYLSRYAGAATEVRGWAIDNAAGRGPDEVLAAVYAERADAARAVADLPATRAVQAARGPISPGDFLVTRTVEMVVHADDLSRSLPDREPVQLDRTALRIATQALADVLAARAPGRSLELRVPPYAAVQCVQGPRHTRGTPPNVVETDPVTWVRLAAGRLSWAEATAGPAVHASGERADLGPWLPLF